MKTPKKYLGLCIRCQRRVDWLENRQGFRSECERETGSVVSCYGFVPVKPLVLEKTHKDARPLVGPAMFAARACSHAEAKASLEVKRKGSRAVLCWEVE